MTSGVPAAVTLCACGHAFRMHERDDAEPEGRGACMHGHCGCSSLRPKEAAAAVPPAGAVASDPVEKPDTPPEPAPNETRFETFDRSKVTYRCDPCGLDFERPQALGAHKRYKHGGTAKETKELPEAAKQGSPGQHGSSAAVPSVRPDNGDEPAPSGTATTGEADAEPRDMRPAAGLGALAAIARYTVHAVFVMPNDAGTVDVHLTDATEAQLLELLPLITSLPAAQS